jgi:hypothetical protein
MARSTKTAESATLEIARSEAHRLRLALTAIQTHAALLAETAQGRNNTLASGFCLLAGLAGDALEGT